MKTTICTVLFLTAFIARGASMPSNAPTAVVTGVTIAKDARTLVIRYEFSGRSHERKFAFTNEINDFRYCRWLGEQGIAVAASTRGGEFYYATLYLDSRDIPVVPAKIPAPASKYRLLGIANTGGDSIVITAVQHRREGPDTRRYGPDRLSGWMFIDNCPPIGATMGIVIPFDIPTEQAGKAK